MEIETNSLKNAFFFKFKFIRRTCWSLTGESSYASVADVAQKTHPENTSRFLELPLNVNFAASENDKPRSNRTGKWFMNDAYLKLL